MRPLLILRPQPGADATAARASAIGLRPVIAPLFAIRALPWACPQAAFEAVILTSANAVRCGGDGMTSLRHLPCHAVGEATAQAARAAGFTDVRTGPADGAALIAAMRADGIASALHLCGADRTDLAPAGIAIVEIPVYAADPVDRLPEAAKAALERGAVALLHSSRAATLFARLADAWRTRTRIVAISSAAAQAAGAGWADIAIAQRPRDEALLELAAKLCQTGDDE